MSTPAFLLQVHPSLNVVLGVGLGVIVGVVGWLLNRTIAAFDTSVKESKEVTAVLVKAVAELREEMRDGHRLTDYLEKRVEVLEHKKETLEKAFAEMDKIIDREIIHKKT